MAALVKLVNRLSLPLRDTLENAVGEAMKRKASTVETAHWLYHIIFGKNVELQAFLEDQGVSLEALQADFEREMPFGVGADGQQPTISGSLAKLIEQAWILASVELDRPDGRRPSWCECGSMGLRALDAPRQTIERRPKWPLGAPWPQQFQGCEVRLPDRLFEVCIRLGLWSWKHQL